MSETKPAPFDGVRLRLHTEVVRVIGNDGGIDADFFVETADFGAELVRRWNAHEGMLSALQRLVDAVDAESDGAAGPGVQFPAELKATIEQARAALRAAKGE